MSTQLLTVTSTDHAIARNYYRFMTITGVIYTLGILPPPAYLVNIYGDGMVYDVSIGEVLMRVWALTLLIGGVTGWRATRVKEATQALRIERGAALTTGLMMLWALVAIVVSGTPSAFGVLLVGKFAVDGLDRSRQVHKELKKVERAQALPSFTSGEYLAEPDENNTSS